MLYFTNIYCDICILIANINEICKPQLNLYLFSSWNEYLGLCNYASATLGNLRQRHGNWGKGNRN